MKKATKFSAKKIFGLALIVLAAALLIQTIQVTFAQSQNPTVNWSLKLQVSDVSTNASGSVFAPFDQIQLTAKVTYNNASQPDILVSFQVNSPSQTTNPVNITRIETTNSTGQASILFRLPVDGENQNAVAGTWLATATAQTNSGGIQQTLDFTSQWPIQITSMGLLDSQGQSETVFAAGDPVTVQLAINNTGLAQPANITIDMQDAAGNTINSTEILNSQIDATSANSTQVQTVLQIPTDANNGQNAITAAVYYGNYGDVDIPAAANQTVYLTVDTDSSNSTSPSPSPNNTATPTPNPTQPPTPGPNLTENSVSLFSWLLVAIGLFTFTSLFLFLKRKSTPIKAQTPFFAPSTPSPVASTSATSQAVAPQEISLQSGLQATAPTAKVASEKVMEATVMSDVHLNEPAEMPSKPAAIIEVGKPEAESAPAQESTAQPILVNIDRISSTAKRIQALEATLKSKKIELSQDLTEFNNLLGERERSLRNYFSSVRQEMEKAKTHLTDIEDTVDTTIKPNLAPDLPQEPTLQMILACRKRIANTEKVIQALTIALKIEKEQIAQEITEFNKQIDDREKTLNDYYAVLRQEVEKLQACLSDKED